MIMNPQKIFKDGNRIWLGSPPFISHEVRPFGRGPTTLLKGLRITWVFYFDRLFWCIQGAQRSLSRQLDSLIARHAMVMGGLEPINTWTKQHDSDPIASMYAYLANGQPFELLGIPYLVGKIKFKLFFQGPLAKWVWYILGCPPCQ